eukprot:GFUD01029674.1.p1 GENE.GFUD01029674.1~~GFUD01029674.1.p1  ORF type:complete len:184 (+),score=44.26 GFUD01029674.1:142-693(+)
MLRDRMRMLSSSLGGMLAGGGARLWRSELLGTELVSKCYVPVLHQKRHGHVTFTTNDNPVAVVSCGGFGEGMMGRSCIGLNTKTQEWETMADLLQDRRYSSAVTMPDRVIILGGVHDQQTSSEFLDTGMAEWKEGPALKGKGAYGSCAVRISSTSLLLIGGKYERTQVRELDTTTWTWKDDST